jgi:ribosomal protein L32
MTTCSSCGGQTPEGNFCVRCGAPLAAGFSGQSRGRSQFAAAPNEGVARPAVVSTLFPRLPRDSRSSFRLALGLGTVAVIVLAALRLFPVALIAAALLFPTIVVLYLVDANIYEDEPIWVMGLTIGWGAAAGIAFGLLALAVEPSLGSVIVNGTSQYLVVQGLVLPFCGFFVLLLGPLILFRYQRFNDILDGVAFGATAAAWFSGAQAITYGIHLIGAGLRPGGAVLPWIWRLLSLAVGMPVLTMGAASAACAALWLRYRSPARDANALGALGHPAVALPLAGLLVMGGAVGETFLPAGGWLAWLAAFDVVAVSLLRRAIHVGLLEESAETPIGGALICPNCGHLTARHTFCSQCGISLQASPKLPGLKQAHGETGGPLLGPSPGTGS